MMAFYDFYFSNPLSAAGEERANDRSDIGVSKL